MITIYDEIIQGSDEWFEIRKRKLTGSHATSIAANGKGLITYCKEIVIDLIRITERNNFISKDMERGNLLEPTARNAYEFEKGVKIKEVGFIENSKYENVGISPDGLINDDGGIEIKARNDIKHFSLLKGETTEIPYNQIQMCLMITNRDWWDFVSINTNFKEFLFIKRIFPDYDYFKKLEKGFKKGNELINEYLK